MPVREKKATPDRSKKDDEGADFIEINPYGDMICTVIFLAEIAALLWHAKQRSKNEGEENVLFNLLLGILAMMIGIFVCKKIGVLIAVWISRTFVKSDPIGNKPLLRIKFSDQFWQLVVHVSMTAFELYIVSQNTSWLSNVDEAWAPPPWNQTVNPLIQTFYMAQLCIWIATGLSHKFLEERHKDYFVMYIHHIATLGLIFGSWSVNYTRIGVLVLLAHDSSDIIVDLLKLANNLKLEDREHFFIVEGLFITNLITWLLSRGWYLGMKVIPSTAFGSVRTMMRAEFHEDKYKQYDYTNFKQEELADLTHSQLIQVGSTIYPLYTSMNILLVALLLMNLYWYYLFIKILIGLIKGESAHKAGGEHYEGSDDKRD